MARCIKDNIIEIIPFQCPPLQNITCENGKKPVLVYDKHQCCQYYTCDCFCEGWGQSRYITFDGHFYSHQGNCTYILMEEIQPQYHLKIYINSVYCDPDEHVSCPRSVIVSYNKLVITLTNHNLIGDGDLEAVMDNVKLKLPYDDKVVTVISSGLDLILSIPKLNVKITFGATSFGVNLPFQHFGNNTQGHCGTCNNNKADDCMIPGGILVNDCAVMADYWPSSDVNGSLCTPPTALPTAGVDIKLTPKPCEAHSYCNLLNSELFKECHPHLSPKNYFLACKYDSCHISNPAMVCTSLQSYARACSQVGVCIHWRNYTNLCNIECSADKVFNPCGPAEPPTCAVPDRNTSTVPTEGCFCLEGTLLFNKESGVCVNKCGCLDASGMPRKFGEVFEHHCEECTCNKARKSVICKPKNCPHVSPVICTAPSFVLVNVTNPSDPCCSKQVCKPKKVCVHNNIEYEPGTVIPFADCQECNCTWDVDPTTQFFKTECQFVQCNQKCDPGYNYMKNNFDKCCGKCVQTQCIVSINGIDRTLKEGETLPSSNQGCDKITCTKVNGQFITNKHTVQCPPFNISNCQPGTVQLSSDGCCRVCVDQDKGCKIQTVLEFIKHNDCHSVEKLNLTFCSGDCTSSSWYIKPGMSSCTCCQATRSSNRTVNLDCGNRADNFITCKAQSLLNALNVNAKKARSARMAVDSMGTVKMSQMRMLTWVVLLVGLQSIQADFLNDYEEMDIISNPVWPTTTAFSMTKVPVTTVVPNPDHRSTICSTWGNFHFKTFDGHFFQVADTCNYVMTVMCDVVVSDFNIQMQRETVNGSITFNTVTIVLEGAIIKITNGDITIGEEMVSVPTYKNGIKIEGSQTSVKISNKHGVTIFWEEDNSLTIELPEKYRGLTCGLCGDFNGNKDDDITVSGLAKWKVSTPLTETCEDVTLPSRDQCNQTSVCQQYLSSTGFADCHNVMEMSSFEKACVDDLCQCYGNHDCLCNTLTEISRQCTHAGGKPETWRTEQLCPKTCPLNLRYMECGGPCRSTCSDPGTVEDDIGQTGCVPVNECPCVHDGTVYRSGESYKQACKKCECAAGHWTCTYLECPGICSIVGGSHVTTYDGKTFTFSGNCDYVFTKHSNDSDIAVVGNLAKCDPTRKDTCLNSVTLVIPGTTISFSTSGSVAVNGISLNVLPFTTGPISIFQPSSSFIVADMKSLRLEIQLAPIMQLYIVASTEEKGKMSGLCGNYNNVQKDDFKTGSDIIEGTPTSFVNFWKQNCPDIEITFDNPCSLNIETEKIAKDWCSRLTNPNGTFSACHSEISPEIYYDDYCSTNPSPSFRLVTENIPCATTKAICSKVINLFFGRYKMILSEEGDVKVVESNGTAYRYQISSAGIYVVIEGKVCGLCGNFDGNANNDFIKHNGEVVTDPEDFGSSWKMDPNCPDVINVKHPCEANPHRRAWAVKQCRIITSPVFTDCHSLVDSGPYYDACERDTCACDSGGDCDCLCTAVAAYAAECRKRGACVAWRRPDFCRNYVNINIYINRDIHNHLNYCNDNINRNNYVNRNTIYNYWYNNNYINRDIHNHTNYCNDNTYINRNNYVNSNTIYNYWYNNINRDIHNHLHYCNVNTYINRNTINNYYINIYCNDHTYINRNNNTYNCNNNTYVNRNTIYNYWYNYINRDINNHTNYCNDNTYINRNNYVNSNTIYNYCYINIYCNDHTYINRNNNTYNCNNNTYVNRNTIYNYWYNYINRYFHTHTNFFNYNTYININNYVNSNTIYNYWYNNINRDIHNHLHYCNVNTYINRNTINN
ncbi:intestinal mucin [Labeo rohita]|uniref:Intestinal mucin n=1 Tax=Labeo rohita TaxID=84645 RepID=A0A498MWI9_LABRO|nr:intestinal mucin [Labeo rohita]